MVEGWVFCGYDLLLYRWERGIALATTDADRDILARMEMKMVKEKNAPPDVLVPQTNGDRYAGPVISGRWQVMESFSPRGTYYVVDHWREDLLVREAGPGSHVKRFVGKSEAEAYISQFTTPQNPDIASGTADDGGITKESRLMARSPKGNAAAATAAAKADSKLDTKPAAAKKAAAGGAKAAAKAKEADAQMAAAKAEAKSGGSIKDVSGRGRTIASAFREAIAGQKKSRLTDEQIHDAVEAEFGKKIAKNAVSHYRADVERRQAAGKSI
jgi:hypothetical protein